jgi:hypothetical protein
LKIYAPPPPNTTQVATNSMLRLGMCGTRPLLHPTSDSRQRITEAVELITPHMLINTWQEREYRLDICRATTGAHIEVY